MLVLLTGSAVAQSQQATMPGQSNPAVGVVALGAAVPRAFANAPELSGIIGDRTQMEQFVANNPASTYTPWLRNALASTYRHAGRITAALNHYGEVWRELQNATDSESQNQANHALAGQLELLTSLGRVETLHDLLKAAEGRTISDPEDRRRVEAAREGYLMMVKNPNLNYRCGTLALAEIARMQGKPTATINALIEEPSPKEGISLLRLVQLSRQFNLGLIAVKRIDSTPLPVPCVVHWAQNHYGALLEYRGDVGFYRAIFGEPNWISVPDVDAEASGYFLIPSDQRPASWPVVPDSECAQVLGRSYIYKIDDSKDKGCKANPTDPKQKCPTCPTAKGSSPHGMPTWWVSEPYVNLWLADEPVGYTTSLGEDFSFRITVKQRDAVGNTYAYLRPGLLHNWYSRIYIQGMPLSITQYMTNNGTVTTTNVPVASTNAFLSWNATVDLPTGGQITYSSGSLYDEESKTKLMPSYGTLGDGTSYVVPGFPLGGNGVMPDATSFSAGSSSESGFSYWNDGASGFRIFHPDGSIDRYGLIYWRTNTSAGYYDSEALLTQKTDPLGNDVNLYYESYTNSGIAYFRLKQLVDYDGKTNNFTYISSSSGVLQKITTAYNQTASFGYDGQGNLTNITDAVTNNSSLTWDANGRVQALNTPYGPTSFSYYDADLPGTNDSSLNGDISVNRSITVVDPTGGTNIFAYCFNSQNVTASQFSANVIPQSTPLNTLDTGTNEVSHDYAAASFRNSFYWDTRQSVSLSTSDVSQMTATDFMKARMQHWLGDSNNVNQTELVSVEQEPSPDGTTPGQLTFFDYYGKTLSYLQGTNSQIAVTARRQPSGNTEYAWNQYNSDGFITKAISTYMLADGVARTRTNSYTYATNSISVVLNNYAPTTPAGTVLFYLNDGAYNYSGGYPAYPLIAAYELSDKCGAWSQGNAGTSTFTTANLLTSSVDAAGNPTKYGGYNQVSTTTVAHDYTAWWYSSFYMSADWKQRIIKTYTPPLPTKITNSLGYVATITYNSANQVTSIRTPSGLTTTNRYDSVGFLTNTVDIQIARTNSFTYTNGLIYTWQNELGLRVTNTWDKLQRLTSQADQEGVVSRVYTKLDLTASSDKLGKWTYYGYDPLQHLVAITNANQEVTLASYCSCGALDWQRDALGNYTYYTYDLAGRLTKAQYPDGYTVTNTYNPLDQLMSASDSFGYVTNTYNLQGLITTSADGVGIIVSNSYDVLDRLQSSADSRGVTTSWTFDAIDRIATNIVAGATTNTFVYSTNGLIQTTDGLRTNSTLFQNDALQRPLFRTNANNEVTQFQYDPAGNLTNLIDGKLQKTIFQFDSFGRLTNKLDNTLTSTLKLTYDADGRTKTRWTPEKGTITYVRDAVERVRTNSYPSNSRVVFSYDSNGRLTNMVDGLGTNFFSYSPAGQLLAEGGLWTNDIVSRTYTNRLRSTLTLNSATTTYNFDAAHRLRTIAANSGTFTYTYHSGFGGSYSSPLVQAISIPNGMTITNGYDVVGRLTATALLNSNAVAVNLHGYTYDSDSRRIGQTRYDNSSVTYGYDRIGQLKTATANESGGASRLNEQFGYSYDAAGNLSYRTNNTLAINFGINSVNELTNSATSGTLTAAGNTAQAATSVSVNGQTAARYADNTFATTAGLNLANGANSFTTVVQYATQSFTNVATSQLPTPVNFLYDSNGNLTNDGLRTFVYDDENQLASVSIAGQWRTDFAYDGLARRRVIRDYSWNGAWNLTNETHYIFDGKLIIQERDANNRVTATYDRGLGLDGSLQNAGGIGGLLARTDPKGTVFYHSDAAGNITILVDKYQTLEARYLYDPFGNIIGKWGGYANVNDRLFSSMPERDGLVLYPYRAYDPNLQRFLSRDPIGERGGDNLYCFVANNPINEIDPQGLWWWDRGVIQLGVPQLAHEFFFGKDPDVSPAPDPNSFGSLHGIDNNFNGKTGAEVVTDIGKAVPEGIAQTAMMLGGEEEAEQVYKAGEEAYKSGEEAYKARMVAKECRKFPKLGWKGSKPWRDALKTIQQGGQKIDLGFTPTKDQALDLLKDAGIDLDKIRIEGPHEFPNPHDFPHINYPTPGGGKGTIPITGL